MERFTHFGVADAVLVHEQSLEDCVVERPTRLVVGVSVEHADVGQQAQTCTQNPGASSESGTAVVSFGLKPCALFPDPAQALADLALGKALLGKVDQTLFALVEVNQARLHGLVQVAQARLLVDQRLLHVRGDELDEVGRQLHDCVVLHDVVFDQHGWEVRQIAQPTLLTHADEVLVLAAIARGPRVDQFADAASLLAAEAVQVLLEIMEVRPVAPRRRRPLGEDLLDNGELLRRDDRLVPAREEVALVTNEPHVIRVSEHRMPLTD